MSSSTCSIMLFISQKKPLEIRITMVSDLSEHFLLFFPFFVEGAMETFCNLGNTDFCLQYTWLEPLAE